jgi:hypothetical protein
MARQQTCGQGLAAHSELPAKLAELTAAVGDVLDVHSKALDPEDESTRPEQAAYERLVEEHREIAAGLQAIGEEMVGYRDLPMGRHDPAALSSPEAVAAFERVVHLERDLLTLLEQRIEEERELLDEMRRAG